MFDDLDFISVTNQKASFPKHFHSTFCISLILTGVEQIDLGDSTLYSEAGSISITNPFEVHSNPLATEGIVTDFDTVYISADLMKYYAGENIVFINRKIIDNNATRGFLGLKTALNSDNQQETYIALGKFIAAIKPYAHGKGEDYETLNFAEFQYLEEFIEHNILDKFDLDELSRIANSNKYGFVKKFKLFTGMTPMNYIIMRKIFSSKLCIQPTTNLSALAYQYNFSDLAHFSKTFKRYIGISPKDYQRNVSHKNKLPILYK